MEEIVFDSYAEFKKFNDAKSDAYFNNEDMSQFKKIIRLTEKARDEMFASGCVKADDFFRNINQNLDFRIKEAEERRQLYESQEED